MTDDKSHMFNKIPEIPREDGDKYNFIPEQKRPGHEKTTVDMQQFVAYVEGHEGSIINPVVRKYLSGLLDSPVLRSNPSLRERLNVVLDRGETQ